MTVYVDEVNQYPIDFVAVPAQKHGTSWSHLWADDVDELHRFAQSIGLKRGWFQNRPRFPHYDVTPSLRTKALKAGAISMPLRDWLANSKQREG